MRVAYPRFYQAQSSDEIKTVVDLWAEMFKDTDTADAVRAVKELIKELEFPPTIADVSKKVKLYEWERRVEREAEAKAKADAEHDRLLETQRVKRIEAPLDKEERMRHIIEVKRAMKGVTNDEV